MKLESDNDWKIKGNEGAHVGYAQRKSRYQVIVAYRSNVETVKQEKAMRTPNVPAHFCIVSFGAMLSLSTLSHAQVATLNIPNINTTIQPNTPLLFGITFDARTSMSGSAQYGQVGYYNANGTMIPEVDAIFNDFPMTSLRYPGNAISVGFDWKKSVGAVAQRPAQNLLGGLGPAQSMQFGFDEFMAMTEAKGVAGADVQIMIPIYDVTQPNMTATQTLAALPNVAAHNADWVEYCNAPNDGSNPGGGTDYASMRAANGHPAPYGIKIWNIGNEPWAPGEYAAADTSFDNYEGFVTPIIDAMLAIDPTLHITLPATGNPQSNVSWIYALLNSNLVAQGKIYGVSQHYFGTENQVGSNPPAQGINAVNNQVNSLGTAAANHGLKVFVGDYAHGIPNTQSTVSQNLAMQWQGANLEADMLLMLSQKNNLERCNFWAYGLSYAVWHPIRINSIGNYTLMPAADMYKILKPTFLDHSIYVATTSPAASDGNPYAVRSSAFASNDLVQLNVVAVNRDRTNTVNFMPSGTTGYTLNNARILTATALDAEQIDINPILPDALGQYAMPAMSVLILEYSATSVGIDAMANASALKLYPDPTIFLFSISLFFPLTEIGFDKLSIIADGIRIIAGPTTVMQPQLSITPQGKMSALAGFPYLYTANKAGSAIVSGIKSQVGRGTSDFLFSTTPFLTSNSDFDFLISGNHFLMSECLSSISGNHFLMSECLPSISGNHFLMSEYLHSISGNHFLMSECLSSMSGNHFPISEIHFLMSENEFLDNRKPNTIKQIH